MEVEFEDCFGGWDDYAYVCSASYEERALMAANFVIGKPPPKISYVFHVTDCCEKIERAYKILADILPLSKCVPTMLADPIVTAKAFSSVVDEIIERKVKNVLVDVSTFTHEHLLIFLRILLDRQDELQSVVAVYSHPGEYSPDRSDEEKWLSKGCREVRSVFGYPGVMIPGSPTALILLAGFEVSRACAVVSEMDPAILYIGKGVAEDREKMIHQKPMEGFAKMVREFCATRDSVSEFDFFAKDMEKTEDCINKILDAVPRDCNRVIVPMNSKISTIACARIAIKHPDVQLCYAQPEAYNITSYSTVGNRITLLNLFSKLPVGKITGLEALAL